MPMISTPDDTSRRNFLKGVTAAGKPATDRFVTRDGASLYFKDWGIRENN